MLDVIERVGVGGNYLKERVTRERVRALEHFTPTIGSRLPFEQWAAGGSRRPTWRANAWSRAWRRRRPGRAPRRSWVTTS